MQADLDDTSANPANPEPGPAAPFTPQDLPVLLLAAALVLWFSFQLVEALEARDKLEQAIAAQEAPLAEARKISAALDGMAAAAKKLAREGNPNAAQLVANLASRGINIQEPPPAPILQK